MRLNGQVVHYKGLHDTYDVAPIAFTDSMTVSDVAKVINPLYVDVMAFKDGYSELQVQAEAIEVLSTEGVQYATTDTITFADAAAKS